MATAAFIAGQILTATALNNAINSKVDADNTAITNGTIEGVDHVYITGTNVSTNPTSGALTVVGGVGIGGDVNTGGRLTTVGDITTAGNSVAAKGIFSDRLTTSKNVLALNATNLVVNSSGEFGNLNWTGTAFGAAVGGAGQGPIFLNGSLITTNQKDTQQITIGQGVQLTIQAEILASGVVAGRPFVTVEAFNASNVSLGVIATATLAAGNSGLATGSGTTPGNTAYVVIGKGVDTSPNVPVGGLIFRRIKLETGSTASLYSQEASISALQGNSNGELTLNVGAADVTLTADQFSNSIFKFTGALTGNRTVTVPATNHAFIVQNLTTNAFTLTIKAVGQTPSASVLQNKASSLFSDATGVFATSSVAGMQFAGVFSYAASQVLALTQLGSIVNFTAGGVNATLPAANTYPAGSGIGIYNGAATGNVSVVLNGTDTWGSAGIPQTLLPADFMFLYSDGVGVWTLGWYSNKIAPTFEGLITTKGGIKMTAGVITFPDGTVQSSATGGTAKTVTLYSAALGNTTAGATTLVVAAGFAAPFVDIYRNGLHLVLGTDFTLGGDNKTITLLTTPVTVFDEFEVSYGYTYNPSTVYVPSSTLYTPAAAATGITGLSYTPGFVYLYRNGVRLVPGVDFTATDGVSITFVGFIGDGVTQYELWQFIPLTPANTVSFTNPVLGGPLIFADGTSQGTAARGFKNWIHNGNFNVWQRGTSFANTMTNASASYTADRWQTYRTGFATNITATQASGISLGGGSYYGLIIQRATGDTSAASLFASTSFETIDVRQFAGQTLTLSYNVFGSGGFVGKSLGVSIVQGTGTDGSVAAGFTGQTTFASRSDVLSGAGWQTFSITFTVPLTATQFGIAFGLTPSGTAVANEYFALGRVQLEIGGSATPFEFVPVTESLRRCKRYFQTGYCGWDIPAYTASIAVGAFNTLSPDMRGGAVITLGTPLENVNVTGPVSISPIGPSSFRLFASSTAAGACYYTNTFTASAEL